MTSMHSRMVRSFSTSSFDRIRVMGGAPGRVRYDSRPVVIGPVNAPRAARRAGAGGALVGGRPMRRSPRTRETVQNGGGGAHVCYRDWEERKHDERGFHETTRTLRR